MVFWYGDLGGANSCGVGLTRCLVWGRGVVCGGGRGRTGIPSLFLQLPQLIHTKAKGWRRGISFLMINIGFILSFVALLLLAIYEEDLDSLVTV